MEGWMDTQVQQSCIINFPPIALFHLFSLTVLTAAFPHWGASTLGAVSGLPGDASNLEDCGTLLLVWSCLCSTQVGMVSVVSLPVAAGCDPSWCGRPAVISSPWSHDMSLPYLTLTSVVCVGHYPCGIKCVHVCLWVCWYCGEWVFNSWFFFFIIVKGPFVAFSMSVRCCRSKAQLDLILLFF